MGLRPHCSIPRGARSSHTKTTTAWQVRTIWNASVPGPHVAKSAFDKGKGLVLPVASNAAALLPSYTAMAWLSIERVCFSLHIRARVAVAAGETLQGRSRDFAHWFKMFHISRT